MEGRKGELATLPLSNLCPDDSEAQIFCSGTDGRHRSLQPGGHKRETFSVFRHGAKHSVILFRPTFRVI